MTDSRSHQPTEMMGGIAMLPPTDGLSDFGRYLSAGNQFDKQSLMVFLNLLSVSFIEHLELGVGIICKINK